MTEHDQPIRDKKLEDYLDGLMSESEAKAFGEVLRSDGGRNAQVNLQVRIDASVARLFGAALPPEEHVQKVAACLAGPADSTIRLASRRLSWIAGLAAAASIAWIVFSLRPDDAPRPAPFFEPTSVAQLYHEVVANGFEPYYECRDDARFAAVFAKRQGTPLRLLPMPAGSQMLGLSYPGGLSRNTTAMLCMIDDQPVMVFVDRLERDQAAASIRDHAASPINVFRIVRDGLVFYEVSPFDVARAIDYLVIAPEPQNSE